MKDIAINIISLLVVSIASIIIFAADKWQYFCGESYIMELVLMFTGTMVANSFAYYKSPFSSKGQFLLFLGISLINTLVVIPPIVNNTAPITNIKIFQVMHLVLIVTMCFTLKKRLQFTILSCLMIYCDAIAYRLNTIGYPVHDGEGLAVGCLEMIISITILFIATSIIMAKKTKEE